MSKEDYQWPNYFYQPLDYSTVNVNDGCLDYAEVEGLFSGYLPEVEYCLVSSGRSAISGVIQFLQLGRGDFVYAPPYSSHCIWDSICHFCTPSSNLTLPVELAIVVHKWAYVEKVGSCTHKNIIEDSVDNLIDKNTTLFPNNGFVEIISLPKVTGSCAGALVLSRNSQLLDFLRDQRQADPALSIHQSLLRNRSLLGKNDSLQAWSHNEWKNQGMAAADLKNIAEYAKNWNLNARVIRQRREYLVAKLGEALVHIEDDLERFPPVMPASTDKLRVDTEKLMVRNFNVSRISSMPDYKPHYLIPVHMGIDDELFEFLVSRISLL